VRVSTAAFRAKSFCDSVFSGERRADQETTGMTDVDAARERLYRQTLDATTLACQLF
jgi:hypothetical protein